MGNDMRQRATGWDSNSRTRAFAYGQPLYRLSCAAPNRLNYIYKACNHCRVEVMFFCICVSCAHIKTFFSSNRPAVLVYGKWDQVRVDHGKEFYLTSSGSCCHPIAIIRREGITSSTMNHTAEQIRPEVNNCVSYPLKTCVFNLTVCQIGLSRAVELWNTTRFPFMACEEAVAKRAKTANLMVSRVHWSHMDLHESIAAQDQEAQEPLRRNPSSDDDLVLGVEASLYGNQGVRTVQEFLRVMDVLNLWNDDPEELLLDLGFGCDEPDLSGRIPARFINYQSQARGINLQVFLEAQKSRLDLENPDVSNRFRELEVLQQVTTAFSTLVGSSPSSLSTPQGKDLPPEAREKRRRMGQLLKRISKKSLQMHNNKSQDLTTPAAPDSLQYTAGPGDKKVLLKRVKHVPQEIVCLSPLAEEQGPGPDPQALHHVPSFIAQEGAVTPWSKSQAKAFLQRKKSTGQVKESFEMEEASQTATAVH
ncbi:hypothetical protein GBF38_017406 [Nibea albiflora]|uniref:Uncharacterized protein n=1 Tax=Nibea albiflora TaxID=240163 RepID=A0ACB7F5S3_NIBAL|nr:hypothetical protein GBF38_017406 [Nibea albiflora]